MSENKFPLLPDSLDNALKNAADEPSKAIGHTIADCWYLIFGGISQLAEKRRTKYAIELNKFKSELENSLEQIPSDQRIEPTTQLIMSALDNARYCIEEEELRKLFVNLISSSCDSSKTTHPSFPQIIMQMSPTDAIILKAFKKVPQHPLCHIKISFGEDEGFKYLQKNVFLSGSNDIDDDQKSISISSLIHLGLLEIPADVHISNPAAYEPFKLSHYYLDPVHTFPHETIDLEQHIVNLTYLGKLFVACCVPD